MAYIGAYSELKLGDQVRSTYGSGSYLAEVADITATRVRFKLLSWPQDVADPVYSWWMPKTILPQIAWRKSVGDPTVQRVRLLPTGLQEESPVFYITRSLEVTAAQVIPDMPLPRGVVLFRDDLDKVAHLGEGAYEDAIGFVKTQLGNLAVRLNDWIVTDAQGLCLVYGPEEFEARFNLAVDSADGSDFVRAFNLFADVVYRWAMRKKLWETKPSPFELICLIQEAVASAAKAAREGDPVDRDCPNHNSIEVRLADAIIHIMNARGGYGLRVGEAIVAKMKFNDDRPYVRGRKI